MEKLNNCFYGLSMATLLAVTAQAAYAGESSWYVRGDGAFAFSRPHVMAASTVNHWVVYDVPSSYTATVDEFFEGNYQPFSEPSDISVDKKFNVRGAHYTAGIGRHITKDHRIQIDYTNLYLNKKDSDVGDSAKVKLQGAVASLHLGTEVHKYILPYVMGGVGYGKLKMKYADPANGIAVSLHKNTSIWQAGGGILFPVNNYIELDAGYKCTFLNKKLTRDDTFSYSDVTVEPDGEGGFNALLTEADTNAALRLRPVHSFFIGLKLNIN